MASRNSMLEKILEDFPNCNNQSSVKNESSNRDLNDFFNSPTFSSSFNHPKSSFTNHTPINSQQAPQIEFATANVAASATTSSTRNDLNSTNRMNSHSNLPNTSSFFLNDQFSNSTNSQSQSSDGGRMNNFNLHVNKSQDQMNEQLDLSSSKGQFGWSSCKGVPLPLILRKNEKFVPVQIVESKIIGLYSSFFPWQVFSCINISSFFITEIEAKLLNEINNFHCDNYYGSERFCSKDVVVTLDDVLKLHTFLETSKKIFVHGLDKCDFLGFAQISGITTVIPYICKESSDANSNLLSSQSKSSITSSLSELSIKKAQIVDEKSSSNNEDLIHSPLMIPDDLSNFLMNENEDARTGRVGDCSSETTFNDGSIHGFESELNSNSESSSKRMNATNCADQSNLLSSLVDELEAVVNNFDGDVSNNLNKSNTTSAASANCESMSCEPNAAIEKQTKRFIPYSMVEDKLLLHDAEQIDLDEWSCSYLKMICVYAGFEKTAKMLSSPSKPVTSPNSSTDIDSKSSYSNGLKLVCLNDIKFDSQFVPITIKEETQIVSSFKLSPSNQLASRVAQTTHPQSSSVMNNYVTTSSVPNKPAIVNASHSKKSHHSHHYHQSISTPPITPLISHTHNKKISDAAGHLSLSTKEPNSSLSYLDDLFHKISPTNHHLFSHHHLNNFVNNGSNNTDSMSVSAGCNSEVNSLNENFNNSLYQPTTNYQYSSRNNSNRSHTNNGFSRDARANLHQHHADHRQQHQQLNSIEPIENLQIQSHQTTVNNKTSNYQMNLSNRNFFDELAKHLQPNGASTSLNNLNCLSDCVSTGMSSRNVLNNCNSLNQHQQSSSLGSVEATGLTSASSNFNSHHSYDNLMRNNPTNSSLVNSSGGNHTISSNQINNLALNSFDSFFNSTNHSSIVDHHPVYIVSTITLENVQLKTINIKSSSTLQALLLSEIAIKLFNSMNLVTLKFLLENSLNLKLYDCTSAHKQAFTSRGLLATPDDKLVLYDDFKMNFVKLRQCVAASNLFRNFMPNKNN